MKALGKQAQRGRCRIAEEERKKKRDEEWKRLEAMTPEEIAAEIQADRERAERVSRHLRTLGLMRAMAGPYGTSRELKELVKSMEEKK